MIFIVYRINIYGINTAQKTLAQLRPMGQTEECLQMYVSSNINVKSGIVKMLMQKTKIADRQQEVRQK